MYGVLVGDHKIYNDNMSGVLVGDHKIYKDNMYGVLVGDHKIYNDKIYKDKMVCLWVTVLLACRKAL